jgi:hypothetical protein
MCKGGLSLDRAPKNGARAHVQHADPEIACVYKRRRRNKNRSTLSDLTSSKIDPYRARVSSALARVK